MLLHSIFPLVKGLHPHLIQEIRKEESRGMAVSARVEKGQQQTEQVQAYIGLLRSGGFQGGNWSDFRPLSSDWFRSLLRLFGFLLGDWFVSLPSRELVSFHLS